MGTGIDGDTSRWEVGYLSHLAERVGGAWLRGWVVVAAALSNIGLFEAEMSSDSFQLQVSR